MEAEPPDVWATKGMVPNMNDYRFGNFVCTLREKKGMTQADLANLLGVTPAAVSKWENGISKPRVEVLFRLASILDVRPEELIAGQYLDMPEDSSNSIDIQQINNRYEYLQKIEPFNSTKVKFKRLLAWVIDWYTIIGSGILLTSIATAANAYTLSFFLIPATLIVLSLKDFVFGGRSLGKRITKLAILDTQTGEHPRKRQLCIRNLFAMLVSIDGIIVLASGRSLGDRLAHTVIVPQSAIESAKSNTPQTFHLPPTKHKTPKWLIALIIGGVALFIAASIASSFAALNMFKNTEQARLAHAYLVESEAFQSLKATVEDIQMTGFETVTKRAPDGSSSIVAEVVFSVKGRKFIVICHCEDGKWYVCSSCTAFS